MPDNTGDQLIGRDAELDRIRAALAATVAGEGGSLVITGQPGMGKSRLLDATIAQAQSLGLATAPGRASERDRSAPLAPLRAALQSAQPVAIDLSALTRRDDFSYLDQIAQTIDDYVAERPLAIIIDDAQWADEFTIQALRYLIPELNSTALRWIITRRTGPLDTPAQDLIGWLLDHGAEGMTLGPLDDAAIAQLCARIAGATPDPSMLALAGRAEGNPFLLEQLLEPLLRSGQIVVTGPGLATVIGDELPSGFYAALAQRLRDLAPPTVQLVRAGAVLGGPFSIAAAARVLDEPVTVFLQAADEAVTSGILVAQEAELRFRHDLLRESVYNTISSPVRAAMHLQAATVLRAEGRSANEVADHLLHSGPTNGDEAVAELRAAAALAAGRAPGVAAAYLVRAIALLGEHDPRRTELSSEAVGLLAAVGRLEEARDIGEAALRSGLDGPTEAVVLWGLAEAAKHNGQNPLAAEYAGRALAVEAVPDAQRAKLHAVLAHSIMYGGDPQAADEAGRLAEELGVSSGEISAAVWGLVARSTIARSQGRLEDSLRHASAAVDLADRHGGGVRQRHPRIWLGNALAATDRFPEALAAYAVGEREAKDLGSGWSLPLWPFVRASLLSWQGDLATAEAEAEAGLKVTEQVGARQLAVPILGLLTRVAAHQGDQLRAGQWYDQMRKLIAAGVTAPPEDIAWTEGVYFEANGEPQVAYARLAPIYDGLPDRRMLLTHDPAAGGQLIRMALAADDPERAARVASAARALAEANPGVGSLAAAADHAEALLTGDPTALRLAAVRYEESPRALARARAFEDAAEALRRAGRRTDAQEFFGRALKEYEAAGAGRHYARLAAHRPSTATAKPAAATGIATLTPAELAVAELVAQGLSNRKAATQLFVSPHTVDTHLRHIFAKLRINSRVELTREMLS